MRLSESQLKRIIREELAKAKQSKRYINESLSSAEENLLNAIEEYWQAVSDHQMDVLGADEASAAEIGCQKLFDMVEGWCVGIRDSYNY